jgi:hypothetical protein
MITAPREATASLICKRPVSDSGFEDTGPS